MRKNLSRAQFLQLAALGIGGVVSSAPAEQKKINKLLIPNGSMKPLRVICAGAHPGDPEFGCGGTMAKYSQAGHRVTFLYLTRGEAGDPSKTYAASAALRTREAELACEALHAVPKFAGQIDGNTVLSNQTNEQMMTIIATEKPDIVFTHWPLDTHPDHQVTGLLVLNAWKKMGKSFDLYFYEVNSGSETMLFVPTDYMDITALQEQKKTAMYAHKTQDPINTYNTFFKPMEAFRGLEAGVTAAEAFIHLKTKEARAMIANP